MTRRKSGRPRSPSGFRSKGNLGERVIRERLERLGHTVLDGKMAESAVDLILLCCQELVEVKTQGWSDLPSPKRRVCAQAGDRWRAKGYRHTVICHALEPVPEGREVGMDGILEPRASTLLITPRLLRQECRGGPRTGGLEPPVPPKEREAE